MSGKRLKKPPKGQMARRLVYYCISVLSITLIWAIVLKTVALSREVTVDVSDVLTYVGVAFGGELLLLALKRIFAKPNETEEEA